MKILKRRRNIERATTFKVRYYTGEVVEEREFVSLKSMRQWIDRQDAWLMFQVVKTLAMIDDQWEPFTTIGKKTITMADLENIVRDLREDIKPSKTGN